VERVVELIGGVNARIPNMIKTLRITTIVTAILAGLLFVFPVFFGVRADEKTEQFLNSPGVVEKFKQANGNKQNGNDSQVSPLVKQAEAYALYLNPAPEPTRTAPIRQQPIVSPKPPKAYAKFSLVGTSVHATKSEESLAFIKEPGKGLFWVRPGSKVGHVTVEQIGEGLIVCRDEQGNSEQILAQPRQPELSLLEGSSSASARTNIPVAAHIPAPTSSKATAGVTTKKPSAPQISEEENAALDDLIEKLKVLQSSSGSDKTSSPGSNEPDEAALEKLISDLKSTHVDAQEAEKLGNLGKELNGIRQDPNRPQPSRDRRQIMPVRRIPVPPRTK